jgi:hypothetical protein
MFIGHWAPALVAAAYPKAPRIGTLFVAAQLVDWAFFALLLMGVERMRMVPGISAMNPMDLYHMPYTHSLVGAVAFAVGFGALLRVVTGNRTGALIGGAVVLSHWFLDLLVHVPDLTLAGGLPKLGLGLWNHPWLEIPLELALTLGAMWLYARARRPAALRLGVLAALLLALQMFSWFGPVAAKVTPGTSLLALTAYGIATLAAWWVGKSETVAYRAG